MLLSFYLSVGKCGVLLELMLDIPNLYFLGSKIQRKLESLSPFFLLTDEIISYYGLCTIQCFVIYGFYEHTRGILCIIFPIIAGAFSF